MRDQMVTKMLLMLNFLFALQTFAQGPFQNLDFEAASNMPVFEPHAYPWWLAADALPGWSCYTDTNQNGSVFYDAAALDTAAVDILSSSYSFLPLGFLAGQYCVALQGGLIAWPPPTYGPASIRQSGQLPSDAHSIQFRGSTIFEVSFAGNGIPLVVLSAEDGYNVYGGDISKFAGQTGELCFSSRDHFSLLDEIQFSPQTIPEPTTTSLVIAGLGLFYGYQRRWRQAGLIR